MLVFVILFCYFPVLISSRFHHAEGHDGVKRFLLIGEWFKVDGWCANGGLSVEKRVRNVSIGYETTRTGGVSTGEDFQNIGTFMVLISTVFAIGSGHKTHLARDA